MPPKTEREVTRRDVIRAAKVGGLGLLLGGGFGYYRGWRAGHDSGYTEGQEDIEPMLDPNRSNQKVTQIERDVSLDSGGYEHVLLEFDKKTLLDAEMTATSYIDVLVMDASSFGAYENGEEPPDLHELTELDTTETRINGVIQEGDYVVVFDNSDRGKAEPTGDAVDVSFVLEAYQRHCGISCL